MADETAARLTALGHDVLVSPLLEPVPRPWSSPTGPFDAVLFTSPQGPRLAGETVAAFHTCPVVAVGERTAAAAQKAGFTDIRTAAGDVVSAYRLLRDAGLHRILHLAGQHRTEAAILPGLTIDLCAVYEARLAPLTDAATIALKAGAVDWALLFSARTAAHFANLCPDPSQVSIAAISPKALAAAGPGWRAAVAAAEPTEARILAAAGLACDKPQP